MDVFKFANKTVCYNGGEVFVARVDPTIADTDELLRSLYYLLWFPGYFGLNWNTLYDCLRNLDWISEKKVMIVHESLPSIPDADLCIYLEVLKDSVLDWVNDEGHQLEVVFHEKDKETIDRFLSSCQHY
ncbi:MAG: barstar family protein [Pantoea sp.]|uniref:barstar family protein n=1 Tax=Pantoea sp. TaxID=69393 RepID=UPI000EC60578|nr:barstar family protein [Pantoea sp.]MDU7839458.1 barstar family protein [Pantoea sp.]HAB24037.1 hypothetical protein [Pantoea sp.]